MSDTTRFIKADKKAAEERCDHEERWVSHKDRYTLDACWGCILDVCFPDPEDADGE